MLTKIFKQKSKDEILNINVLDFGIKDCDTCGEIEVTGVELKYGNTSKYYYNETHDDNEIEKLYLKNNQKDTNVFCNPNLNLQNEDDYSTISILDLINTQRPNWINGKNKLFELSFEILNLLIINDKLDLKDIAIKYKSHDELCDICQSYYHYNILLYYKNELIFDTKHNGLSCENRLPFLIGEGNNGSLFNLTHIENTLKILLFEFLKKLNLIKINYFKSKIKNFNLNNSINCETNNTGYNTKLYKFLKANFEKESNGIDSKDIDKLNHLMRQQEDDCCINLGKDKSYICATKIYNKFLKDSSIIYEIFNNQLLTIKVIKNKLIFSDLINDDYNFFEINNINDKINNIKKIEDIIIKKYNHVFSL